MDPKKTFGIAGLICAGVGAGVLYYTTRPSIRVSQQKQETATEIVLTFGVRESPVPEQSSSSRISSRESSYDLILTIGDTYFSIADSLKPVKRVYVFRGEHKDTIQEINEADKTIAVTPIYTVASRRIFNFNQAFEKLKAEKEHILQLDDASLRRFLPLELETLHGILSQPKNSHSLKGGAIQVEQMPHNGAESTASFRWAGTGEEVVKIKLVPKADEVAIQKLFNENKFRVLKIAMSYCWSIHPHILTEKLKLTGGIPADKLEFRYLTKESELKNQVEFKSCRRIAVESPIFQLSGDESGYETVSPSLSKEIGSLIDDIKKRPRVNEKKLKSDFMQTYECLKNAQDRMELDSSILEVLLTLEEMASCGVNNNGVIDDQELEQLTQVAQQLQQSAVKYMTAKIILANDQFSKDDRMRKIESLFELLGEIDTSTLKRGYMIDLLKAQIIQTTEARASLAIVTKILRSQPHLIKAWVTLAELLQGMGDIESAWLCLQTIQSLYPENEAIAAALYARKRVLIEQAAHYFLN